MNAVTFHLATTSFAIIAFVSIYTYKSAIKKEKIVLNDLISLSLTAGTIPTGLLLVVCAFDTSLFNMFDGLRVYLAIAGLTFLFTIVTRLRSGLSDANKSKKEDTDNEIDPDNGNHS